MKLSNSTKPLLQISVWFDTLVCRCKIVLLLCLDKLNDFFDQKREGNIRWILSHRGAALRENSDLFASRIRKKYDVNITEFIWSETLLACCMCVYVYLFIQQSFLVLEFDWLKTVPYSTSIPPLHLCVSTSINDYLLNRNALSFKFMYYNIM